jgi:hypothetical protein
LKHVHRELIFDDFKREILLPNKMSQLGPFMSKGDADGDGIEDLYISGSIGSAGSMYTFKILLEVSWKNRDHGKKKLRVKN